MTGNGRGARTSFSRIARRDGIHQARREPPRDLGKERGPQIATPLKGRFGGRLGAGKTSGPDTAPKFYDPPGEARPDWWIVAGFAKAMGFKGFDWKDSNEIFEESARFSRGDVLNYYPLVAKAKRQGRRAHDLLRELGTQGIQTPIRQVGDRLVGTTRLHDSTVELGPPKGPRRTRRGSRHSTRTRPRRSCSGATGRTSRTSTRQSSRLAMSSG